MVRPVQALRANTKKTSWADTSARAQGASLGQAFRKKLTAHICSLLPERFFTRLNQLSMPTEGLGHLLEVTDVKNESF